MRKAIWFSALVLGLVAVRVAPVPPHDIALQPEGRYDLARAEVELGEVVSADDSFEQIVIDNTAGGVGFTALKITPASGPQMQVARCRLRTAEISFTTDGTTPTTSVGTLLEVGDVLKVIGHDRLLKFRGIRTTGSSGGLDCSYSSRID